MFKNPLKYQSGGSTPTQQQQDQLVRLFQAAAKNAQVDPEALVKKAQELGQDENAAAQFMEGLQKCAQGDPAGIQFIKSLFTPSHKHGGKIQDFICKHGKGGAVAGCGCEKPVEKHQQENGRGRGIIGALSGLYNRFIGQRMPDVPGINNRRVRTWTDANGIQHIVEDANINGNSTVTTIDINGADTLGTQKITTGDGRYRMVNLRPETPQWRSVMSRNIPQQENGGKVEKSQEGSVLDYYSNKWNTDLARIKSGWNKFKESAPGKVWGAFMPNPNSETGMLGAAAPIGKIKYIPEGVQSPYKWMPSREYVEEAINRGTEMDDLLFALKRNPKLGTNPAQMFGKEGHASRIKLNPTREEVENFVQKIYNKYSR